VVPLSKIFQHGSTVIGFIPLCGLPVLKNEFVLKLVTVNARHKAIVLAMAGVAMVGD
jgi:hypothetical protein